MAFTDEFGRRVESSWLMTEDTVRGFAHVYRDAVKVEGSLEIRKTGRSTSDVLRSPRQNE